jgi:putative redox protein
MTVRSYADRKGWALDQIEVRVRHAARRTEGAAKDVFSRDISLIGDLSREERARLFEIAERCPVSRTLAAGVDIQSALRDTPLVGDATS